MNLFAILRNTNKNRGHWAVVTLKQDFRHHCIPHYGQVWSFHRATVEEETSCCIHPFTVFNGDLFF